MRLSVATFNVFKAEILVTIVTFITSFLIAKKLGLVALGIWSILRLINSYLECFGRLRTEAALIYFIGNKKYKQNEVFFAVIFINLLFLGFLYLFSYFNFENIYMLFFKNTYQDFRLELKLVIISLIFQFFLNTFISIFPALNNINKYNKIYILNSLITLILSSICLLFTSFGVLGLCIIYIISPLICLIYSYKLIPLRFLKNYKVNYSAVKDISIYSVQFYLGSIFQELQQSGSKLIAASILNPVSIAFIDQGQKFTMILQKTIAPFQVTLLPVISSSNKKKAIETLVLVIRLYSLTLILCSIILYILIKPIILNLYGIEFSAIINVVYILIPSIFFKNISFLIACFYSGIGKPIKNTYMQIISLFVQIFLTFFLIERLGFYGVAIAILFSSVIYGVVFIIYFLKSNRINFKKLIPKISDYYQILSILKSLN
tara:strand:- start:274 stop:1572 length:1299 start_codon:yes stop_codon:yes gene_type:complete